MADTGCQSCLAGIKIIHHHSLRRTDLISITMKMKPANNKDNNILGAAILRYTGKDKKGNLMETKQLTYVTDNTEKVFLNMEACISLGIITDSFPRIA